MICVAGTIHINNKIYKNNFNASLESNNIYLISGRNGSGKSTLIGILLGVWNDYSGKIFVNGKNIKDYRRKEILRQIGICLQKNPIFADTIRGNLTMGENRNIENYISMLSFDKDLIKMGRTLDSELSDSSSVSGGQAQKIGIIRAISKECSIYIFDEPTSNLDSSSQKEFYDILKCIKQESIVILISHDDEAKKYVDQVIEL